MDSTLALPSPLLNWPRWRKGLHYIAVWTVPALAALSYYHLNRIVTAQPVAWVYALVSTLPWWYLWAILTPGVIWLANRYPINRDTWKAVVPGIYIPAMLLVLGIQAAVNLLVFRGAGIHEVLNFELLQEMCIRDRDQPAATQEARGIIHVKSLPAARGRAHNARGQGREGGAVAKNVNYAGTITWLDGTFSHPFQVSEAINVTVQASVKSGKLRVYLSNSRGSYQYIEATPGHPVELTGRLVSHKTGYYTFFESVDGLSLIHI